MAVGGDFKFFAGRPFLMNSELIFNLLNPSWFQYLLHPLKVLAESNQQQIVDFCKEEGIVLLADEVTLPPSPISIPMLL